MVSKTQALLAGNLSPYSPSRSDGEAMLGGAVGRYLMLLGLRGFWPMSSIGDSGEAIDLSGQARHLTLNGALAAYTMGANQMNTPYIAVNSTRWLSRTDEAGLDITGTETFIADKGLTIGCWVALSSAIPAGNNRTIIGKWDSAGNQRSYAIQVNSSERPMFALSSNGSDFYSIVSPNALSSPGGRIQFVCGRFDLFGTDEMSIFVSKATDLWGRRNMLEKTNLDVGVPASIHSGTADFTIGAEHGGINPVVSARVSLAFLCAAALSDSVIFALYHMTRKLFKQNLS